MSAWRKSSYSSTGGANCVEVDDGPDDILVRDTKQTGLGAARTVLTVSPGTWRTFTTAVRRGSPIR